MATKNIKFGVFCNQMIGHIRKAPSIEAVIKALPKKVKACWSSIKFIDGEGRTITITREYLEDQGMTILDVVEDWIEHGDTTEEIMVLNPSGSGTIYL